MTNATMFNAIWSALGGNSEDSNWVTLTNEGALPSVFPVTELASTSMAAVGLAIAQLRAYGSNKAVEHVHVDRRLASFWFDTSLRPIGWQVPNPWDAIAGDYKTQDGWIRLHTNAPHHRLAAERILGTHANKAGIAQAVAAWHKADLETAIVQAGGCAALMRSTEEWAQHPQGRAIATEPLIHMDRSQQVNIAKHTIDPMRPLAGIKVLDLTRVLAGPVATRCLAAYGAQVLRIDPPDWDEPGLVPEVTPGKRLARLDLRDRNALETVKTLIASADVFVHGYRPGALARLGLDSAIRRQINPGLIDVGLDAYGWTGLLSGRRGFDSVLQMSCGIAEAGMQHAQADKPVPMPVQALDQATGYLMAAAAIVGITERLQFNTALQAKVSLARTAQLLIDYRNDVTSPSFAPETDADKASAIEHTPWGDAQRLHWPILMNGCPVHWATPARPLGSDTASW